MERQTFGNLRNFNMKTAYLIFHLDSYDYDSQTFPLMVCGSKERAEDVVSEICIFGQKLGRRLFDEYRDENGETTSNEVYEARCESNRMELEASNWPYSYEYRYDDFEDDYSNRPHKRFKSENLKIQELPLL